VYIPDSLGLGRFSPITLKCLYDYDLSSGRKYWSLKGAYVFNIRRGYPRVHMSGSDLCAVCIVGKNISTRVVTVWQQGKAKVNLLLGKVPPEPCTAHEPTCGIPYETVEMIITHLIHDINALKTCSLICRSWYIATVPHLHLHLHHTLTLRDDMRGSTVTS